MATEFTINSQQIESKINNLLPSQAGFGPGVDFSASTMVIPIVDLTETAEGSPLRQDLQTSFGINTEFDNVANATTTIVSTTGYYRLLGRYRSTNTSANLSSVSITDGISTNTILLFTTGQANQIVPFDINIFLSAGDSCVVSCATNGSILVASRQIATIDGELVAP